MPVLTGDGLTLRPIHAEDAPWLLGHWSDPDVRRFLFDGEPVDERLVLEIVADSEEDFRAYGYGLWLVLLESTPVGVCGLRATDDAQAELLYSVDPKYWGQGVADAAVRTVLDYGLGTLRLPEVIAELDEGNQASERVARAAGMMFQREHPGPHGILKRFVLSAAGDSDA
ncbi:GNAT family N-acetyltransferase [Acrocarpospora catenulata]|uniref:GNAT family N-acetyltransferase n=1 Tax=Acrocarpospora catenulata TaxID=2836182 RepID=UPI001BD92CDC|nr:GNAT family N-acetyltransferase [Acrocarpospora catenulata]